MRAKEAERIGQNAIPEPIGYHLTTVWLFIRYFLIYVHTYADVCLEKCCLHLSQVANRTVNNEQHTEEEVLARISAEHTGSPKQSDLAPRLYRHQMIADVSKIETTMTKILANYYLFTHLADTEPPYNSFRVFSGYLMNQLLNLVFAR